MARHLTEAGAVSALRRGKQIEQLIGFDLADGRRTIRWLTISPGRECFSVRQHHVFDEGDENIADVSEFAPVDESEDVGEGWSRAEIGAAEEALRVACDDLGANPRRWVNQGVIDDEYLDRR